MTIFLTEDPDFLEETVVGLLNLMFRDEDKEEEDVIISTSELAVDSIEFSVHFLVFPSPSIVKNTFETFQRSSSSQ